MCWNPVYQFRSKTVQGRGSSPAPCYLHNHRSWHPKSVLIGTPIMARKAVLIRNSVAHLSSTSHPDRVPLSATVAAWARSRAVLTLASPAAKGRISPGRRRAGLRYRLARTCSSTWGTGIPARNRSEPCSARSPSGAAAISEPAERPQHRLTTLSPTSDIAEANSSRRSLPRPRLDPRRPKWHLGPLGRPVCLQRRRRLP